MGEASGTPTANGTSPDLPGLRSDSDIRSPGSVSPRNSSSTKYEHL